jgi:LCP family protein required for cell wall assembly
MPASGTSGRPYKTYRSNPASARRRARDEQLMGLPASGGKGSPPPQGPPRRQNGGVDGPPPNGGDGRGGAPRHPSRRRVIVRRTVLVLVVVLVAALAGFGIWFYLVYRTLDEAVAKANARIDDKTRAALAPDKGSIFSNPTTILVLGVDKRAHDPGRSDSIMLMRSDPGSRTFRQLSIARDMWVDVPGHGMGKINTGYFWGGPALAIKTVEGFTGVPVNHVIVISLNSFPRLIDAIGGVDVDVPETVTSWYSGGKTVTFKKGVQHMDGKQAMIYSRIRKVDDDFHRQARQQQVMQALQTKLASKGNFWQFSSLGGKVMKTISTDLTTWQLAQLAWRRMRAKTVDRAIMKGSAGWVAGQSVVLSDKQANLRLIRWFQDGV